MEEGTAIAAYDLQPDGLEFSQPVTLTVRVPLPPDGGSFQILHNIGDVDDLDNIFEPLEIKEAEFDADANLVIVSAEVSHFSKIIVTKGVIDLELVAPDKLVVGQPFTMTVTVRRTLKNITTKYGKDKQLTTGDYWGLLKIEVATPGPWTLEGSFRLGENIDPDEVFNRPPLTSVSTDTFTVSQMFTCDTPGRVEVAYRAIVTYPGKLIFVDGDGEVSGPSSLTFFNYSWVHFKGQCVAPLPTPTSTPTPPPPPPTPTPSPIPTSPDDVIIGDTESQENCEIFEPSLTIDEECEVSVEDNLQVSGAPTPPSKGSGATAWEDVFIIGDKHYPSRQFYRHNHDECFDTSNFGHYHSHQPEVFSLEGGGLADPDPSGCGYGKYTELPEMTLLFEGRLADCVLEMFDRRLKGEPISSC